MAQERVQIRLDAVDNTKRAFKGIQGSIGKMRSRLFSLQSAFATLGAGLLVKSFVSVGNEVENLSLRFNFLFGSVKEGQKAFDGLVKFAGKVPFSLQEIAMASGNLAVVSKDAVALTKNLKLAGNVAAVTGLDFRTVGEQLQRSFSSGISSADLFRERGVNALLGFKAGASVSIEETVAKFEEVFGEGGKFGRAAEVLGTTLTGTLSMLTDKLFKFRLETNKAGFFDFLKQGLIEINRFLDSNSKALDSFAVKLSDSLIAITRSILMGSAVLIDSIAPVFIFVGQAMGGLLGFLKSLPEGIRSFGIIGFLMLGGRGKAIVLIVGKFIDEIRAKISVLIEGFTAFNQKLLEIRSTLGLISKKEFAEALDFNNKMLGIATNLKKPYEDLNRETKHFSNNMGTAEKIMTNFLNGLVEKAILSKEELAKMFKEIEKANKSTEGVKEGFKKVEISLEKINESLLKKVNDQFAKINEVIATGILNGIKSISQGLAESIVLGKKLNDIFRNLVQNILVKIIQHYIEEFIIKKSILLLDKAIEIFNKFKENSLDRQNQKLKQQIALQSVYLALGGGGGGFGFGFAEGGKVEGKANGGSTNAMQPYVVGERGRELFIPSTDGTIIPNHQMGGVGATNINFTVQATDVKGVQELLIDNRATITNIINTALNQKGKPALV